MVARRPKRRGQIVMTQQQAEGFFSNLAKKAFKLALPLVKKEAKKRLPGLARQARQVGLRRVRRTKIGRQLGVGHRGRGLKRAGAGHVRRRRRVRRR